MQTRLRTTKTIGLLATGLLAGGLTVACGSSPAPVSAACKTATAQADAYVSWVIRNTTYPNDSVTEGMAIQGHDLGLISAMVRAGCAPTTKVAELPSS